MRYNNRDKSTPYLISAGVLIFIVLAVVIFLIFGLRGEKKASGTAPGTESAESVTCVAKNLDYPFFSYDKAADKTTKVNMIFNNGKLASIYFAHEMHYANETEAEMSETENHAEMNKNFGSAYNADAFNAKYDIINSMMRMSLYTEANKLTEDAKKYFLASNTTISKNVLIKNYESQGFSCKNNN